MDDVLNPHRNTLSSNGARKRMARGAVRQTPRVTTKMADAEQVQNAIDRIEAGCTIERACSEQKISVSAFDARVHNDPELARQFAAVSLYKMVDRADVQSQTGNAAALSVFAKVTTTMAAALDQARWGAKVQVNSQALIINTNLNVGDGAVADLEKLMAEKAIEASHVVDAEDLEGLD